MIGRYYSAVDFNCAHFVADYYHRELGVYIPVVNEFSVSFLAWMRRNFIKIDKPVQHCLVLMKSDGASHIGVYSDYKVLHNYKPAHGHGSVISTELGCIKRNYNQVSFWQWSR